jgi:uncharacterized membrane protein YhaH (DUF805 family)
MNLWKDMFYTCLILLLYFTPMIYAEVKRRKQRGSIGLLNLVAGWTIIGWVAALIWAAMED